MKTIQQTVRTEFCYPVHFTRRALDPGNTALRNVIASVGSSLRTLFVVDEGVCTPQRRVLEQLDDYCRFHSDVIENVAPPILVRGGETVKNDECYLDSVRSAIHAHGICRHSFVIAVGGGATLDMAGYAAATSHRGVRLIRMPSTVLAQNDSGLGVKTSVNRFNKKNFLGTFTPPFAVINDFELLESLSDRDWRSGAAEAVKVSLIKDKEFFRWIEESATLVARRNSPAMECLIYRCAQLHLEHIGGSDPFETGSSRPLDFGHWAAHKLEQLTHYNLRHGEAVAIGIALDVTYSHLMGMLVEDSWERILGVLVDLGLPVYAPELETSELLEGLTEFREHLGGELTILLLEDIGRPVEVHEISPEKMRESVAVLSQYVPVCSLLKRAK
ncbi:MAG TPA: 3-dehydroquinate synthase [Bryobacteraceae bacterium]